MELRLTLRIIVRTLLRSSFCLCSVLQCERQPPADSGAAAAPDPQVEKSKGGLLSSLRQALEEDPKRDVVRGYFDVGVGPDTRRYYCLVNPKTGKFLENGASGRPTCVRMA